MHVLEAPQNNAKIQVVFISLAKCLYQPRACPKQCDTLRWQTSENQVQSVVDAIFSATPGKFTKGSSSTPSSQFGLRHAGFSLKNAIQRMFSDQFSARRCASNECAMITSPCLKHNCCALPRCDGIPFLLHCGNLASRPASVQGSSCGDQNSHVSLGIR